MRLIVVFLLLLVSKTFAASVVTVTPITESMSRALLIDTPIEVVYLPPKRLPINRISSWLNKHRTDPMAPFDSIVNISSMRPDLNFYSTVRSRNIHVIPIDIAEALLPGGERVAVQKPNEYFWLNPNNALLMLGILKRDLSLIWPEYAPQIAHQHQKVSQSLRQIALELEDSLLESGYEAILNASGNTQPFTKGLLLPTLSKQESNEATSLKILTVSTKKSVDQWLVDDFSRHSKTTFINRWKATLENLNRLHK
ncbi:hypothetical protein ABFY09_06435 [Marinomonas sp. 5E14-1]|uniref:hypothetical protein n=1 Tax=Marinomonas sp. 5E14-1 TaxID=3153922 RepID=UPI0032633D05